MTANPAPSHPQWIDLSECDDPRDVVHRVAACLAQGGVVGLAAETVYRLACSALNPDGVARLRGRAGVAEPEPLTIVVKGPGEVADWVPEASETAERLARRSWPGPVALHFPRPSRGGLFDRLPAEVQALIAPGGEIALGCPEAPLLRQAARFCPAPLVLGPVRNPDGSPATTADPLRVAADVAMTVDSGPARPGRAATAVRVEEDRWAIVRPGAVDAETLAARAGRILAFVCTGNTCRSPMAEAVCKLMLARRLDCRPDELPGRGYTVVSAGVAAAQGAPAAPFAVEVVRSLGGSLERHRGRALDSDLLRQADRLFVMTADHLDLLLELAPESRSSVSLLDPDGRDVPDPVGSDLPTYRRAAETIQRMLARRLDEMGVAERAPSS